MSRGELVTDLRDADGAHPDLGELVAVVVERQHHLVHDTRLRVTQERGRVSLGEPLRRALQLSKSSAGDGQNAGERGKEGRISRPGRKAI